MACIPSIQRVHAASFWILCERLVSVMIACLRCDKQNRLTSASNTYSLPPQLQPSYTAHTAPWRHSLPHTVRLDSALTLTGLFKLLSLQLHIDRPLLTTYGKSSNFVAIWKVRIQSKSFSLYCGCFFDYILSQQSDAHIIATSVFEPLMKFVSFIPASGPSLSPLGLEKYGNTRAAHPSAPALATKP